MEQKDVLIIGGGHAGLYLAGELASRGFSTVLFEKKKIIGEKIVCTGIVGIETFSEFEMPADCEVGTLQNLRFYSPTGFHFDYDPARPLARVLDRPKYSRHLAARAQSRGAEIKSGSSAESLEVLPDKVRLRIRSAEGETIYESRVVIIATGVNHRLFRDVGLQPPQSYLGGAQIHVPHRGELRTEIFLGRDIAPGAFAWSVPLAEGVARIGLLSRKAPAAYLRKLLARLDYAKEYAERENMFELRPIMDRPVPRSYADRVLVVGEAAGQIKSTTGGGIFYGLLGARCAVRTLEGAFAKNDFSAAYLKNYEASWRDLIGEELRFCYYCRRIFAKFTDSHMEELFRGKVREDLIGMAYRKASFEYHRDLLFSMLKMPRVLLHGLKHPVISAELFGALVMGKIA